jgi:hypothetical protein
MRDFIAGIQLPSLAASNSSSSGVAGWAQQLGQRWFIGGILS